MTGATRGRGPSSLIFCLITALLSLLLACSSKSREKTLEAAPPSSPEGGLHSPPASTDAALPAAPARALEVRNDGVGPIDASTLASEESIAPLFPECEVAWQRHKGREWPHVRVRCAGQDLLEVILAEQGQSAAIGSVRVFSEGVPTPSGLGVGSSYRALFELSDGLRCEGIAGGLSKPGVIERPHTLCTVPLFPNVQYGFSGVVFSSAEQPEGADALRIAEIRWTPARAATR